jgi:hypothetical protein
MYVPILSGILISRREHEREYACDVIGTHRKNRKSCLSENPYRISRHPIVPHEPQKLPFRESLSDLPTSDRTAQTAKVAFPRILIGFADIPSYRTNR